MLRTDTWTYFEGFSELDDGTCVMKFFGQVNKADPNNILITEKEAEEDSYRKNVDLVRRDRRAFEDAVYAESDRIQEELFSPSDNCTEISENCDEAEKGGNDEI